MEDYGFDRRAPSPLEGASRVWASLALLLAALAIVLPIYGQWLSRDLQEPYRFGLALLWGVLALAAARSDRYRRASPVLLSLFGVSLGLALAYVAENLRSEWLPLSAYTPEGAAAAKVLGEVLPVCLGILIAALLARRTLPSFGLGRGRVWLSLGLGLLSVIPLLVVWVLDPSGGSAAVMHLPSTTLLSWMPWIVLFSIANGFMEELWFRGSWFCSFREILGSPAAMHVTSIAFCAVHVIVNWRDVSAILVLTPVWLYMGYAYALIVRKTGSLWGAVLAHAIADVMFMYIYFAGG